MIKRTLTLFVLVFFISASASEEKIFSHNGLERSYHLHIPQDLEDKAPLVVVIHGYTSAAENIMSYSKMNEVADREGFAVIYPQGTIDSQGNTFFNVGYEFNKDSKIDDVSFIRELVIHVRDTYQLSEKNIFATGMSNGGDMSYLLACTSSDLFKAVAPVAGVMMKETLDNCNPQNPIPVFEIHGTNDKISLFQGDIENKEGWGSYYGLPETIQFWADKHNLDKNENIYIASKGEGDQNDIIFERYWSEDNINEVWLYKIVDAGHIWPGFRIRWWQNPLLWYYMGSGNDDISASEEVWKFFKQFLSEG